MSENLKNAFDIQIKFRFYFIALVFTFLAATIQTSDLKDIPSWVSVAEILGWISLTISGLTGLSFLEDAPGMLKHHNALDESEKYSNDQIGKIKQSLESLDSSMSLRYSISKHAFIFGLVFIGFARATQSICF